MTCDPNWYRNNPNYPILQVLDSDDNVFNEVYSGLDSDRASLYYSVDKLNTTFKNNSSHINVTVLSARSFKKNGELFTSVLISFNNTPEVIVISETWGVTGEHDSLSLDGYNSFHTTRQDRRSGGVSVYAVCDMQLSQIVELSVCNATVETCVAELKAGSETIIIFAVYQSHSDSIDNFNQQLDQMLQSPLINNKSITVLGDINVDLLKHCTQPVTAFINTMQTVSFIPVITKPTRFPPADSGGDPSLLDPIWINSLREYYSGVLCIDITDHCPVFVNIHISHKNNNTVKLTVCIHSQCNIDKFEKDVYTYVRDMYYEADVSELTRTFS